MPLSDLVRAVPGIVVFGLLPGLALGTLIAPRWSGWLRLAAAPGLSAGLVGVLGLAAHDVHLPFRAWWVGALTGVLLLAAGWRLRTARTALKPTHRLRSHYPQVVALACGLVVAATAVVAFHDQPLPVDSDPAVHAAVAERIAAQGDILPILPVPVQQTGTVRPRAAAEAVAAFAASTGAPSPTQALAPEALLAVLLLPLSLCLLALELTRSRPIAALAPALAAGLPLPALPVLFGEIPLLVDATLVVPMVIAALRALRGGDRRTAAALLAAGTASIWVIHGTEALTAAVVAAPLGLLLLARPGTDRRDWLRGAVTAVAACAAGALLVHLLTRLPALPAGVTPAGGGATAPEATTVGGGVALGDFPRAFVDFVFPQPIWLVPYGLGLVAAARRAELRGLLVAHAVLVLCLLDVSTHRVLLTLWEKVFPWSEPDRLASLQYWVLPVMMAAGVVAAASALRSRLPDPRAALRFAAPAAAVVAALAVALGSSHDAATYGTATTSVGMVTGADLSVMAAMSRQLPSGTPVLTDGIDDAGQWLTALTPDPLYLSKDWVIAHPHEARIAAVAQACTDPQAAAAALTGVGAVFVGAAERAGAEHRWSADCVARIPGLRLIAEARQGDRVAAAFAVGPS